MEPLIFTREQILRRVARVADLKPVGDLAGVTGGMPADIREAVATQTVYGVTSPSGSSDRNFWDAGAVPAGTPNFGAVYVTCEPGKGASWHVHRYSYENFIALKGRWRIFWNAPEIEEHVDLEPFDMVSIPPGAIRRFENAGDVDGLLMAFAYSAEHSLTDTTEIWVPPCEVDRLEAALAGKGEAQDRLFTQIRDAAAAVSAGETEEDRAFTRSVAAMVAAES